MDYQEVSPALIKRLKKGVFLTASSDNEDNTMTIGWATIGRIWNKPVLMVAVRYSRHTYKLLNSSKEFTVSIPKEGSMSEELKFCGTKSGRDFNKFNECDIKTEKAKKVNTLILSDCQYHLECKVIYQQAMEPETLENESIDRFYKSNNDYHVLFYGEILDCYEN
jgi:flavin reductase (DIM6/NTAB) family NADH-FMN oxidoreductase RutF